MEFIKIDKTNIDKEHICCAMSNNQSLAKKNWLKERFDEGLVFYRSVERGKCFIEYIPAESAWIPLDAPNYLYINCLWIAGSLKGKGFANELIKQVIEDAKSQNKDGVCILSSSGKKKEFLSDPKFMRYKGFKECDTTEAGINLMYYPVKENAVVPTFKPCAKELKIKENGFVIYYTDQCPFTFYWVPRVVEFAKENGIEVKTVHITSKEMAQNMPCPSTTYALFKDGKFITHAIQSDKKFLQIAKK